MLNGAKIVNIRKRARKQESIHNRRGREAARRPQSLGLSPNLLWGNQGSFRIRSADDPGGRTAEVSRRRQGLRPASSTSGVTGGSRRSVMRKARAAKRGLVMKGPDTEIDGSHNRYIKDGELTQVRRERGKVIGYRARNRKWIDKETATVPEPVEIIAKTQAERPFVDARN